MSILFFDTETTGLIDFRQSHDHQSQPYCVQIAACLTEDDGTIINQFSTIVDNDGVEIPDGAANVHGITTEQAKRYGIPSRNAFYFLLSQFKKADKLVGHNVQFDSRICSIWAHRLNANDDYTSAYHAKPFECTMRMAQPIVKLPPTERMVAAGIGGYKSPRLEEAYLHFFAKEMENAHDALADVLARKDIYFAMQELADE